MKTAILIIIGLLILWSLVGYFFSRVEQAEYTVVSKDQGYEIRDYAPHIEAQTFVEGDYDSALSEGFRIVASYIFGDNVQRESIAMTAPVIDQTQISESISMTAPVISETESGSHRIAFVMPRKYTLDTLPKPNDDRIEIVRVPAKQMAALRFSWHRSEGRVASKSQELLDALEKDGVEVVGAPIYAGYSAPWTPPWMTRNEVLVQIAQ